MINSKSMCGLCHGLVAPDATWCPHCKAGLKGTKEIDRKSFHRLAAERRKRIRENALVGAIVLILRICFILLFPSENNPLVRFYVTIFEYVFIPVFYLWVLLSWIWDWVCYVLAWCRYVGKSLCGWIPYIWIGICWKFKPINFVCEWISLVWGCVRHPSIRSMYLDNYQRWRKTGTSSFGRCEPSSFRRSRPDDSLHWKRIFLEDSFEERFARPVIYVLSCAMLYVLPIAVAVGLKWHSPLLKIARHGLAPVW